MMGHIQSPLIEKLAANSDHSPHDHKLKSHVSQMWISLTPESKANRDVNLVL